MIFAEKEVREDPGITSAICTYRFCTRIECPTEAHGISGTFAADWFCARIECPAEDSDVCEALRASVKK